MSDTCKRAGPANNMRDKNAKAKNAAGLFSYSCFSFASGKKNKIRKSLAAGIFAAGFLAALVWSMHNGWYVGLRAREEVKLKNLMFVGSSLVYGELNQVQTESVKNSPFDSFALVLTSWGSKAFAPDYNSFKSAIAVAKKSGKKFWPRIMLARIGGHLSKCNPPKGSAGWPLLDVWDQGGCYTDFKKMLTLSLKIAKETGTEGIVVDPEMYNNYNNMRVGYLAAKYGKSAEEIHQKLLGTGADLADTINASGYSDVVVWSLFSDFSQKFSNADYPYPDSYRVQTGVYILEGLLKRAKEKNYSLKLVEGGEGSLWYLHTDLNDLKKKTEDRERNLSSHFRDYPNFHPGGTIGLYLALGTPDNPGVNETWQKNFKKRFNCEIFSSCNKIRTLEDFKPLLGYLFEKNKYVWVWKGNGVPKYDDFMYPDSKETNGTEKYRSMLQSALRGNGACEKNRNETCQNSPEDCGLCPPAQLAGDLNGDGKVDQADFDILKNDFLKTAPTNPKSDIDKDGTVTIKDAGILMSGWK